MLIKIENGNPVGSPISNESFYRLFSDTSFPAIPTPEDVEPFGYGIYALTPKPLFGMYEKAVETTPVKDSKGVWLQTWEVVSMSAQEIAEKNEILKTANKTQASSLLSQTDWTTIPDVGDSTKSNPYLVNVNEFVIYRNQLRTIAVNHPVTVDVWPTKPEEVWATV